MTNKLPITAVIITYNELGYIEQCIESISFADEIVVVDSFSTDGTWEWLTRQSGIKASQHPFTNYTHQKTHALSLATNNWIFFLDADEWVTPELQQEITTVLRTDNPSPAYWNYRIFMFDSHRLRFSGWQTDKVYRLFRKDQCRFIDNRIVHETLTFEGKPGFLKEKLLHYSYKNFEDYKAKMLKYGRLKAQEAHRSGKKWNPLAQVFRPFWRFFYNFTFRLGFLDGKRGMTICYLNALGVHERYKQLKKLGRD